MSSLFGYEFLRNALIGALVIGLIAPAVGIYLVQRRMSLIGDGIGHVALTGVAVGFLTGTSPVLTAVIVAAAGAITIELLREHGRLSGDIALALLFYGGIAGGVLLVGLAGDKSNANLLSYLFGSLLTTSQSDLAVIGVLSAAVLLVTVGARPWLFAVCQDEEYAKVAGLPVRLLNMTLALTAAVTITVAMRAVGLLLVSALMVVPVATAQQVARGFAATMFGAMAIGVAAAGSGVYVSFALNVAPGAAIVVVALAVFVIVAAAAAVTNRLHAPRAAGAPASPEPPDVALAEGRSEP
ncbi:MAG: metal ABC transporter permease [Micromonosporaceae bacterium]|nr:metal ABC transporter permease [Micromonosporaceae bacterium]